MPILSTGNTFATGDNVTAAMLNAAVNDATFATGAVDNATTRLSGGAIIVKDGGITPAKLSTGGPSWSTTGATTIGVSGTGTNLTINEYSAGTPRYWNVRDDSGVDRLRFSRGSSDYYFWDVEKVAASDNVAAQTWRVDTGNFVWQTAGSTRVTITNAGNLEIASGGALQLGNAYAAGAPTATGYLVVKDSTGTSYKIPAVAV